MKKVELVEQVATNAGLTKADALRAIDATFEAITEARSQGYCSDSGGQVLLVFR